MNTKYSDIILFAVTVLVSNFLWKLSVTGLEEEHAAVLLFGRIDITAPFAWMAQRIADEVFWLIGLFRDTCVRMSADSFRFPTSFTTFIVYSCTPIKQCFIWLCIMLTTRGGWLHKVWYIPFGWLCAYGFNLVRIASIAMLTEFHPERFVLLHDYVFKYLFYGVLFLLWVLFMECLRPKNSTPKPQN